MRLHFEHLLFFLDGLGGIGMGLGPGGQPIDANHLSKGIGMGNLGPAGETVCLHWGWLGALVIEGIYWDMVVISGSK